MADGLSEFPVTVVSVFSFGMQTFLYQPYVRGQDHLRTCGFWLWRKTGVPGGKQPTCDQCLATIPMVFRMKVLQCAIVFLVTIALAASSDPCAQNLVTGPYGVPDDHITASSSLNGNIYAGPERGRLNTTATQLANGTYLQGSWAPTQNSKKEYIQVELKDASLVRGVMTQGRNILPSENSVEYVNLYHVATSMDGVNFTRVTDSNGKDKIFRGNMDSDTIESSTFPCPVFAKYVRIIPEAWSQNISMRFDLLGCQIDQSQKAPVTTMQPPTSAQPLTTAQSQQTTSAQSQQQTTVQSQPPTTAQSQPPTTAQQTTAKAAVTTANAAQVTTNAGTTSAAPVVATLAGNIPAVPCVSDCKGKRNGDYQGCSTTQKSCNMPTFVTCSNGILYTMPCPAGLVWNDAASYCDWPNPSC
ncbi:discoidin, CUB and LCCL domain-containing protein 2-like [Ylistrum balloti]|uniref:discoidin, CUB and LCCL domain-containing protein 2-like n=1 Tax=Ylistrum balloti TaxID=509963 RepID=UPI002905CEC8|nr:discoidin, CUB and LCCL domain-containing protein 2-like [Ylistrum balloti]